MDCSPEAAAGKALQRSDWAISLNRGRMLIVGLPCQWLWRREGRAAFYGGDEGLERSQRVRKWAPVFILPRTLLAFGGIVVPKPRLSRTGERCLSHCIRVP